MTDAMAWRREFLKPEAMEVLDVLAAYVFCFRKPVDEGGLVGFLLLRVDLLFFFSLRAVLS